MTWISFLAALLVVYALYYAVNIAYDLLFSTPGERKSKGDDIIELTFEDEMVEKTVDDEDLWPLVVPAGEETETEKEILTERKEAITRENPIEERDMDTEAVSPSGAVQTLVSGGVDLKSLLRQASFGALETARKINFAEA